MSLASLQKETFHLSFTKVFMILKGEDKSLAHQPSSEKLFSRLHLLPRPGLGTNSARPPAEAPLLGSGNPGLILGFSSQSERPLEMGN